VPAQRFFFFFLGIKHGENRENNSKKNKNPLFHFVLIPPIGATLLIILAAFYSVVGNNSTKDCIC
ncbi:MAG: hypothetical protein WBE11_00320, partial [Candidatus Aminicenantaceae bacterium]